MWLHTSNVQEQSYQCSNNHTSVMFPVHLHLGGYTPKCKRPLTTTCGAFYQSMDHIVQS